jgi:hypothetical protein
MRASLALWISGSRLQKTSLICEPGGGHTAPSIGAV